jgi:hypothetical protein
MELAILLMFRCAVATREANIMDPYTLAERGRMRNLEIRQGTSFEIEGLGSLLTPLLPHA